MQLDRRLLYFQSREYGCELVQILSSECKLQGRIRSFSQSDRSSRGDLCRVSVQVEIRYRECLPCPTVLCIEQSG